MSIYFDLERSQISAVLLSELYYKTSMMFLLYCDKFKHIKFFTDRTLLQRNYFKSILDELNNRKSTGEIDLFIKYVNNIPTVSKNGRNRVQMSIS
ncbi:Uncharacterized protein FWK35_00004638 [Aphis craccivora]|uniref:Uncharacterized protein n=1 Tax=Aphis craccivora TaxID=307492 RepID=A0A6G0YWG4_APHCR|nr:Uncharacterized protein FWK35_00004638 [Aphis craccivora]